MHYIYKVLTKWQLSKTGNEKKKILKLYSIGWNCGRSQFIALLYPIGYNLVCHSMGFHFKHITNTKYIYMYVIKCILKRSV